MCIQTNVWNINILPQKKSTFIHHNVCMIVSLGHLEQMGHFALMIYLIFKQTFAEVVA